VILSTFVEAIFQSAPRDILAIKDRAGSGGEMEIAGCILSSRSRLRVPKLDVLSGGSSREDELLFTFNSAHGVGA